MTGGGYTRHRRPTPSAVKAHPYAARRLPDLPRRTPAVSRRYVIVQSRLDRRRSYWGCSFGMRLGWSPTLRKVNDGVREVLVMMYVGRHVNLATPIGAEEAAISHPHLRLRCRLHELRPHLYISVAVVQYRACAQYTVVRLRQRHENDAGLGGYHVASPQMRRR